MNRSHPIRRRSFLLAGGSSLLCFPASLQAARAKLPTLRLIVVSDTHLGYKDQTHAAEQWERTAAELADAPGDLVLHLGDVVDGGREAQYPIYNELKRKIGKPVHEIPGNHDPAELFAKHVREPIDTVVDHQWLRFLLLGNARPDSHDGFLSDEQIEWIDRQCSDAARSEQLVALCLHVPVHTNKHPDRGWYVKPEHGQQKLYEVLSKHQERVLCTMHGHFHNGIRGWNDHGPLEEIVFPSVLYNLDRGLEKQSALGYNLPEFRPGYTLVTISSGSMRLDYKPQGKPAEASRSYTRA